MLDDHRLDGRQLKHLAPLADHQRRLRQGSPAVLAGAGRMRHQVVRLIDLHQGDPWMADLPARSLAAALASATPPRQLGQSVTGRWLMAIVAVLIQAVFQLLHACAQRLDLLVQLNLLCQQLLHQRQDRLGTGFIDRQDLFTTRNYSGLFGMRYAMTVRQDETH